MPFVRVAHRGAAGTRPELTRAAFTRAIELGADMIELDVQLTRDRQLVVLHDRVLGRTVHADGPVRDHTLDELRAHDAGSWFDARYAGEHVLGLADVLELTAGRVDETVISSFAIGALAAVRRVAARARLGVLWQGAAASDAREPEARLASAWNAAARLGAMAFHPFYGLVDEPLVRAAHERGLRVFTWTVNDPSEMRRLAGLGVDGIISDFPERFGEV